MSKILKTLMQAAIASPLVFTASLYSSNALAQIPSTPTNSAQQGCLSGYPDGTFRGDRPVTRYEFAAGLNACLDRVNQLLPNRDLATRAEFEALIQRQRELNAEIRELNGRVGNPPDTKD
ncbi:S-layer homology domain-containing protein [Gloeocapsopsis dulcis]|uniref:S-layer protein n=1 Tax=Gloeocapsopsis dulcis AAB1 = 1H9 TaxID=1433147 RepID=A0A6N8FXE6_9CHRO|nr:S-layer homology domain-containing protein [Gloeocapsopsis dulcis]MUL36817.1 S-layer protein [Gloeocapsopsis dulcis AAB1 = 1H9]WNN88576.1 S-layer homology domain-containing protein [Gloeocapsopsis dulcis]